MSKLHKDIMIIIMIALVFVQISCINWSDKGKYIQENNSQKEPKRNKITLKELNEELKQLNFNNIMSANEVDGKWYVKLKILGDKNELLEQIEKLRAFDITEYSINKNTEESSIIVKVSSKDNI